MKILNSLLLLAFSNFSTASYKVITIAGTADLQGMMNPFIQKFDLNSDGIKEEVMMGGIANLATYYAMFKLFNPNIVIVSMGDDLMNRRLVCRY